MSEVKTLVTLVLGGMFDHNELGDIDIVYEAPACEALQRDLVDSIDDVHVELVSRLDYDVAQSQLAALREELASHLKIRDRELEIAAEHADDLQQRLADAERRNAPQWIECKDRMPEPDVDVLVSYTPLGQEKAIVHGAFLNKAFDDMDHLFWFNGKGEAMRGVVSHWLPMIALNPNPEAASHDE